MYQREDSQKNTDGALHPADKVLSAVHLPFHTGQLPLHPYLLPVCSGGLQEIWSSERILALSEAHSPLPPLGRKRV